MITILQGDVLEQLHTLPDKSVQCCVTSPPYYGLRNYGVEGQIGLEDTPEAFVEKIVEVFHEVKRVLRDDGTLWLNLGDSYAGSGRGPTGENGIGNQSQRQGFNGAPPSKMGGGLKPKDMIGIPWMVAVALRADGWYLRSDIIWSKPNPMPESVTDRPTKAHEYVFLMSKKAKYYYDADAVREDAAGDVDRKTFRGGGKYTGNWCFDNSSVIENQTHGNKSRKQDLTGNPTYTGFNERYNAKMARNGTNIPGHSGITKADGTPFCDGVSRNRRTVWEIATQPTTDAHFATFPEALVEPCIKAGSKQGDTILDPFGGSGTTAKVARDLKRDCILIELNPKYIGIAREKLRLNEQLVNA